MKNIKLNILLVAFFVGQFAFAQTDLNGYLKTAALNNPGVKARFSEYMAAMEKVPQVGSLPDPTLTFGYFVVPVETRVGPQKAKVSMTQMFPWFGLLDAKEDVATEMAKVKFERFEEAKSRLFYDVKGTWYNLYFIEKAIEITKQNIGILNTFRALALIKFETGMASVVDELRVEMEIADLENQLAYLKDSQFEITIRFNNLLNEPKDNPVIIPDTLSSEVLVYDRVVLMDSIRAQNHRIKEIEHRILSWENREIVAQKTGMPDVMLGVDYIAIGKSDNPMLDASENGQDAFLLPKVGITIPLYRKKYTAMVKEASLQMEAATFEKSDRINALSTLFERGYKDYRDGERRMALYEKQLKLAKKSLDILLAEYSTNGKNFEEVLRMERKLLKYKLELDKAKSDKNAAVAFIYYLMGK